MTIFGAKFLDRKKNNKHGGERNLSMILIVNQMVYIYMYTVLVKLRQILNFPCHYLITHERASETENVTFRF